jgi:hypothetical protein
MYSAGVASPVSPSPITQEQFDPFGYPGAGLLLELHMPQVTLRELHSESHGSLAQFLVEVRGEVCKAAKVKEHRVSILGIHGRFKRYEPETMPPVQSDHARNYSGYAHVDEEVVVRFEILPGWGSDSEESDPRKALDVLREELSSPHSGIMRGSLSTTLLNATVTLSAPVAIGSQTRMIEHGRGMTHMGAMAWPLGISAAFIGVLIWLAAY